MTQEGDTGGWHREGQGPSWDTPKPREPKDFLPPRAARLNPRGFLLLMAQSQLPARWGPATDGHRMWHCQDFPWEMLSQEMGRLCCAEHLAQVTKISLSLCPEPAPTAPGGSLPGMGSAGCGGTEIPQVGAEIRGLSCLDQRAGERGEGRAIDALPWELQLSSSAREQGFIHPRKLCSTHSPSSPGPCFAFCRKPEVFPQGRESCWGSCWDHTGTSSSQTTLIGVPKAQPGPG